MYILSDNANNAVRSMKNIFYMFLYTNRKRNVTILDRITGFTTADRKNKVSTTFIKVTSLTSESKGYRKTMESQNRKTFQEKERWNKSTSKWKVE